MLCWVVVCLGMVAIGSGYKNIHRNRFTPTLKAFLGNIFNNEKTSATAVQVSGTKIEFLPAKVCTQARVGQPLSEVAVAAGIQINYKCKKGECGTCEVNINGKWVKACQETIPSLAQGESLTVTLREAKKASKFFSPASFVEGVINNGVGVVGFVTTAAGKADNEYAARIAKEAALAEKVALRKASGTKT